MSNHHYPKCDECNERHAPDHPIECRNALKAQLEELQAQLEELREAQCEEVRRLPIAQISIEAQAITHLANVLEWAKGMRGSKNVNPYCVPEIKASLRFLAELEGIEDYIDVDTCRLAT